MAVVTGGTRGPRRSLVVTVVVLGVLAGLLVAGVLAWALVRDEPGGGSASVRGTGHGVSRARALPPFMGVELAGAVPVTVRVGRPQSVRVTADENLIRRVTTQVRAGSLVIDTTGSFTTRAPMRVTVTVPSLDRVVLSGSGTMDATGVRGQQLLVALSGSGRVAVGGRSEQLRAVLSGSGELALGDLVVRDATARLTGVGEIGVFVTRRLTAQVTGTGSIRYAGDPVSVQRRVTGTGSVSPR